MSSEQLVADPEKGGCPAVGEREPARPEGPWKGLGLCAFALLIAATGAFALLHFAVLRPSQGQDSKENGKSFSEDMLPQTMKVQALISGKPAAHTIASLTHPNKLVWTTDMAPAILENGIQLNKEKNALVVPSTGLYFVYSQLLFHKGSCPSTTPVLLSHSITCWSSRYNDEVELLKSIKTACEGGQDTPGQPEMWYESIYQGAVFSLHKGDHLQSETDSPEYLNFDRQGQIYFGVIAL